ncbi:hypothetical protein, partial [Streptomyces sp. WAC04114]|uniref:hypothetical protein n=1 Tax=Streptomyces sp. WAC04114 TaxID=2867961 RepID=UPI001C8B5716
MAAAPRPSMPASGLLGTTDLTPYELSDGLWLAMCLAGRTRETLSNFLDVAASFAAGDNEASLLAFLGFLRTAAQYEKGLD